MTNPVIEGGCFCGAVRYQVQSELRNLCVCHCRSCRKASGAPFVAWCSVDAEKFELVSGDLAINHSSAGVERGHCVQCGTTLTYFNEKRADDLDLAVASMDREELARPKIQIFVEDRLDWIARSHELPAYKTVPGE